MNVNSNPNSLTNTHKIKLKTFAACFYVVFVTIPNGIEIGKTYFLHNWKRQIYDFQFWKSVKIQFRQLATRSLLYSTHKTIGVMRASAEVDARIFFPNLLKTLCFFWRVCIKCGILKWSTINRGSIFSIRNVKTANFNNSTQK